MNQIIITTRAVSQKLKSFRLSGMSKNLEVRLKQAESGRLGYTEFLGLLLEDEENNRADNRRLRLYKHAKFPFAKGLEDFNFSFQPTINKQEIYDLATCQFLAAKTTILFLGQEGVGKTHLSIALGLQALSYGKTVLFTSVWKMISDLQQSRDDFSYHKGGHYVGKISYGKPIGEKQITRRKTNQRFCTSRTQTHLPYAYPPFKHRPTSSRIKIQCGRVTSRLVYRRPEARRMTIPAMPCSRVTPPAKALRRSRDWKKHRRGRGRGPNIRPLPNSVEFIIAMFA